jgi:signal transduction histidine kinase
MCAGSATVYAGWPPAVAAFLISAIGPVAASCLLRGDAASISLGVLAPFFALNLHAGARRACREKLELLRQRAELERTAAELETALLMTQRAEAARTRFLATVSHELRTPLNAIVGFADLMQSEAMGPLGSHHYRDYVTDIGEGARRLRRLVDEIVAFARLDAPVDGGSTRSLIDLRVPCREAAAAVARDATARGIILTLLLDEAVPARLLDGGALTRAIRHLLENAVKFSDRGQNVRLVVSRRDGDGVEIRVEDRGIGMDEVALAQALLPFRQLEETIVRQVEGLGLGLPLARALIEREGGRLELESAPGRGTIARIVFI